MLKDIEASNVSDGGFRLWWLGQSGFLLQWQGVHVLLDPYLSDSLTRKYAATDKPHIRMTPIPIHPAQLAFVDVVTSSHNHTDHLDAETLQPLLGRPSLLIPEANRAFVAERLRIDPALPIGLADGESVELHGIRFTGVMSAHEEPQPEYLGYVLQFGGFAIYHSGDTIRYAEMAEKLTPFHIDVALLPINGRGPERRVAGNLWGHEAAQLARDIGAKTVIPCHYEMFTFNTAPPDEFIAACQSLGQPFHLLRCGERYRMHDPRSSVFIGG